MMYAYERVSSLDQNLRRQDEAIHKFAPEITDDCIFSDKQSGKDFDRPAYKRLVGEMRSGDVLVVKSIDRLGRNYDEILEQWRILTKERGIDIAVIDMPLLDTRKGRDLTGTLIADIVLQLLSYVAQTERENIRQRQKEGIAKAKSEGVAFGRPKKELDQSVIERVRNGELSVSDGCRELGISRTQWYRITKGAA